jgi:cytochrome c oxidase subunit 3
MGTVVHDPPQTARLPELGEGGGERNLVPAGGDLRTVHDRSPEPSRTGIWVGLAAITMSFAALTSALIVRQGTASDWRHFTLPSVLYLNTLILLASSVTLEVAKRRLAGFALGRERRISRPLAGLAATLLLGLAFVAGQYLAWQQLRAQGLFLATNPSSSFFYLLTALHALHVLGGLAGLSLVINRLLRSTLRRSTVDVTAYYWHFMGVLWLYLFLLLGLKL